MAAEFERGGQDVCRDDRAGLESGSDITGVLGRHAISIASVLQHEGSGRGTEMVPLVIMTHEAREDAMSKACAAIDKLDHIQSGSVRMRVRATDS